MHLTKVVVPTGGGASVVRLLVSIVSAAAAAIAFLPATGAQSQTATMSLSPQDTFLNVDTSVNSSASTLNVYTWPDYQAANAVLMKFDLSSLPTGAVVQQAVLRLSLVQADTKAASSYTVTAHKIIGKNPDMASATGATTNGSAPWTASGCCYNGVPLAQSDISAPYATVNVGKTAAAYSWTITNMVREWRADPSSNYGLLLNADATKPKDSFRYFASMQNSNAALRPVLQVTYSASDATPPTVSMTSPSSGSSVSGTTALTATASDQSGVAGVQFLLDGAAIGQEVTSAPYSMNWSAAGATDGTHVIAARARDVANNTRTSAGVTVTVSNGGLVLSPADTSLKLNATNYSTGTTLWIHTWPDRSVGSAVVLKFSIPSLPQGTVIQSASLQMALVESDAFPEPTYTVTAHKILGKNVVVSAASGRSFNSTTNWTPSTCCYASYPMAQSDISTAYAQLAVTKTAGLKTWNLTTMVQEWVSNPATNFGVLMNPDKTKPKDRYRYFASREHPDASLRPVLRIQYSGATGGTPAPAPAPEPTPEPEPPPPPPPPPPPSGGSGIAARYPGDVGIENDPAVVFVEKFDEATLSEIFNRWGDVLNGSAMLRTSDRPAGSPGGLSLTIPWVGGGVNNGGHLYKVLNPAVTDTLYLRYYIKYPSGGNFHHSGIWMGGFNPASSWPNPQAGVKPVGNDRFIAAAEQNNVTDRFDHYNYWMAMRPDGQGSYWGDFLLNNPAIQAPRNQWVCVEHMVKLNNPVSASNGEHAIWLNGVKVSHLGQGFPTGSWSGGIFTQGAGSTAFEGFRWRSTTALNINWIWLQNYSPDDPSGFSSSIKYDHVVAARSYIGCLG